MTYSFTVPGVPVAKGRPKFRNVRTKDGREFTTTHTPPKTASFENKVAIVAQEVGIEPIEGPVHLTIIAAWPMKGSKLKNSLRPACWKTTNPDLDNLVKAVMDALIGIAYEDDNQVCSLTTRKIHVAQGEMPETRIEIEALTFPPIDEVTELLRQASAAHP